MISDYKISRKNDFQDLKNNLSKESIYSDDDAIVCEGDSLEILKSIPNKSISLILIDPPYHSTKKKNIKNDTAFSNDDEFIT